MIDYRVPVDPTETPRHTAQRLVREADLTDAPAESATLLGRAEERARYARQPLQGGELTVEGSGEDFTVNGDAEVVCGNVTTDNATVYLIDGVLPPAA